MSKTIFIPSSLQYIHIIEEYIERVRHEFQIGDCMYGNMHLAVVEAVTNAIVHGNKLDASKKITFQSVKNDSCIKFIIEDQGNGFDENNVPDPTLPENKEKLNGRGVFLIKNLADEVEYFENGSILQMVFYFNNN